MTAATDRRVRAIRQSGWGRSFALYQPRNAAFWVYLVLVVAGAATFVSYLSGVAGAYGRAIAVSGVLLVVYGAIFWAFTHHIDRYSRLPAMLVTAAAAWGAFAATWMLAAVANDALRDLYAKSFGQVWATDWGAALTAPFTEEIAKGLGLVLLIALAPRLIRTAFDGFIVGAFVGLGFQIAEDIVYAVNSAGLQFGANQVAAAMGTVWLRMAVGVAAHILYSAVFCAGLVYLLGRPAEPRRPWLGLGLTATAIALHGLWNSLGSLTRGSIAWYVAAALAVMVAALIIVTRVYRLTVPRERAFLREILAPETAAGVVTAEELLAICGDHRTRRAFRAAGVGRRQRRRHGHTLDAIADLADALANAHGRDTDAVAFARAEVARVRAGIPSVVG